VSHKPLGCALKVRFRLCGVGLAVLDGQSPPRSRSPPVMRRGLGKKTAAEWWARRRRGDGGRSEAVVVVVDPVAGGNLWPRPARAGRGGGWLAVGRRAVRAAAMARNADLEMLGPWWRPAEHDEPFRAGVVPVSKHPSASCGGPQQLGSRVFGPPSAHPAASGGSRHSHAQGESFRRGRARPSVAPFGAVLTGLSGVGRHALRRLRPCEPWSVLLL
jgi:hypothetical protein